MKEKMLKIADKLCNKEISEIEAKKQFSFLFGVTNQRKLLIEIIEQFNEDVGLPTDNSNIPEFVDEQLKAIYGW